MDALAVEISLPCKHCGGMSYHKNGKTRGYQRYLCLDCRRNFTFTPKRGESDAKKSLVILLYGLGNVSKLMLSKIFNVSDTTISRWIVSAAAKLPEIRGKAAENVIIVDEMWHFVNGKKTKNGYGEQFALPQEMSSAGK